MNKDEYNADSRLKNVSPKEDASANKDSEKLVEVRKKDNSEDQSNEFILHEKPFDEQMHESDEQQQRRDEESD